MFLYFDNLYRVHISINRKPALSRCYFVLMYLRLFLFLQTGNALTSCVTHCTAIVRI